MGESITHQRELSALSVDRLISLEATADLLSISVWTVRKWVFEQKIKSCKLGSRRLIPVSEINRIIENGKQ